MKTVKESILPLKTGSRTVCMICLVVVIRKVLSMF